MGNCGKKQNCDFVTGNYWQAEDYNTRAYIKYLTWIIKLAINRFRWVGLPETCNARVLEATLLTNGVAAICTPDDLDVWFSLPCAIQSPLSIYGDPIRWRCVGVNGDSFNSGIENGAIVYNSKARMDLWNAIQLNARKLAHYDRTEDINLSVQKTPYVLATDDEHQRDIINILNEIAVGEIAIVGTGALLDDIRIQALNLNVPFIGAELGAAKRVLWSEVFSLLGIPNMPYEKGERMIEAEAVGNEAPTNIMLLDALDARREACDILNREFGLNVSVYFNRDFESNNFNYERNLERQGELQDERNEINLEEPKPNIGGIVDTKNFYKITSVVKDYTAGRMGRNNAIKMLESLGIDNDEIKSLLEG